MNQKKEKVYFLALSGARQIGQNFNLFGVEKDGKTQWLIVDVGVSMAKKYGITVTMASVDEIIHKDIVGIVITHGHEDHLGALQYTLHKFKKNIPIYATPFTMFLLREKFKEYKETFDKQNVIPDLQEVPMNSSFDVGPFNVELIHITHSIPEPNMLLIRCGGVKILHTGDWKFDDNPIVGKGPDRPRMQALNGVDFLICDSTNALEAGRTLSEGHAKEHLTELIGKYNGKRVIVSCFASNVARLKSLIDIAIKYNRKVCILGRSLHRMLEGAAKLHYITYPANVFVKQENLAHEKPGNILVICTGTQAEPRSVLQKSAYKLHRHLTIDKADVIIFSARIIPGNESEISSLKNQLMEAHVKIIDSDVNENIHVSGHPSQDDIKELLDLCQPKYIIPVHGTLLHLLGVQTLCEEHNYKNVIIPNNGSVIDLDLHKPQIIEQINVGQDCLDGNQVVSMSSTFLNTRQTMAENGCICVMLTDDAPIILTIGVLPSSIVNSHDYNNKIKNIINATIQQEQHTVKVPTMPEPGKKRHGDELCTTISFRIKESISMAYGKKPVVAVKDLRAGHVKPYGKVFNKPKYHKNPTKPAN